MKTTFIPIDYDYFDWKGKNYIKIIGRDDKGKRLCIIDTCDIYFWAILKENLSEKKIEKLQERIETIQLDCKGRKTKVEKTELHDKKFLEKPVKALKIFITNYKDAHDVADCLGFDEIEKRRGYDLGFITHYIIEKKISPLKWYEIEGELLNNSNEFGGIDMVLDVDMCIKLEKSSEAKNWEDLEEKFKPKILAYDIEVDELQIGKGEILMISLFSNNKLKKVLTCKDHMTKKIKDKTPYVDFFNTEEDMLEQFVEEVKKESPDFLVGYFSDGFDLPYLKSRAEKLNVNLSLGIDGSFPKFNRGGFSLIGKINGIVHIDLLKFIKTAYAQYMQSETLSLNEVASEFLGDEKKDFKFKHSTKIKDHEWEKYFEYNLHDSNLTLQLFEKFWPDMLEFTKTVQEPVFDVSRAGLSKFTENYILHNLEKFNEIPEKRPTYDEIRERKRIGGVKGAFVYEPQPGLYENLVMFDFTSMHTSIIISHNLSKATLIPKDQLKNYSKNDYYESPDIEPLKKTKKGKSEKYYFTKKLGFFPELMKEIFEKRRKFKKQYKKNPNPITKARSNAFKVLSASAHGYVAFFGARYHSHEASASILAFVRKYNIETIEKTKKQGYEPIYGDTDSIAFLRKEKTKKQVKEFLEKLNSELPGVMHMELEDFYKRGLWVTTREGKVGAKKKYALIDEDDNLKIRGFETVRRDWCKLARDVQNKVINLILENGNEEKALEYVKKIIKKIKNREILKDQLIIKTQLKKPISEYKAVSPHVVAAKRMKEQELPISQGNLIEYFIAEVPKGKKAKLVREKVKLPHEDAEYNIEYYLNRQILPAVENIFQVFNINTKEIIDGKKQMSLSDF